MKKIAVITGGAAGIGKSIALKLLQSDYEVAVIDHRVPHGDSLIQNVSYYEADVRNLPELEKCAQQIIASPPSKRAEGQKEVLSEERKVSALVINAGVVQRKNLFELSKEEWDRTIDINLNGSFYTLKAFLPYLKSLKTSSSPKDCASLVLMSSGSALTGSGGGLHYSSSKAGQLGLMKAAARELGALGMRVNAVAPRTIQTEILDHLYPPQSREREELVKKIPLGRIGTSEDVAETVSFLLSDKSSYIHGQTLLVDGGRTFS